MLCCVVVLVVFWAANLRRFGVGVGGWGVGVANHT